MNVLEEIRTKIIEDMPEAEELLTSYIEFLKANEKLMIMRFSSAIIEDLRQMIYESKAILN